MSNNVSYSSNSVFCNRKGTRRANAALYTGIAIGISSRIRNGSGEGLRREPKGQRTG